MSESDRLFTGILESAREESHTIEKKSLAEREALLKSYEMKRKLAEESETRFLEERREESLRILESKRTQLMRESELETTRELREESERALFKAMGEIVTSKEYREALILWIAEGAIALGRDTCTVTPGASDPVSEGMIISAAAIVKRITAKDVKISISEERASSQGVIISSSDNRIAYNNLVQTRLARCRADFENLLEGELCRIQ